MRDQQEVMKEKQKYTKAETQKGSDSLLNDLLKEARGMIDGAYEIVEMWDTGDSPYNEKWKKEWLRKAKELFGAQPMP